MDITWLGYSAVRIQSGQVAVVTDPYRASDGWAMPETQADIVTISRDHPRHANAGGVEGDPRVLHGPGEYEIANFYISGMGTPHRAPAGADAADTPRQVNTVYTMRAEGLSVCHAGAGVPTLTPRQLDELNNTDVLIVDAGDGERADARRAAQFVNQISPRIVIPVGYMAGDADGATSGIAGLLGELGVAEAAPQPSLRVTTTSLPREMRVAALRPVR